MRIELEVRVQPRSRRRGVEKIPDGRFKIRVNAAPDKGKANKEMLEVLADYLGLSPSRLKIVRGETDRDKTIALDLEPKEFEVLKARRQDREGKR
jgi:uncharacterized protein (TIGR00251 family)